MDNLLEVSNVFRTNVSRRRINKKNKRSKLSLEQQATYICKEELSERYIHNSFSKFDGGYVYYDIDEDEILSFCLWKKYETKNEKRLHILLLCSKYPQYSLGSSMINDIENYCFENKIRLLTVTPANKNLEEYYKKFNFIKDENDNTLYRKILTPFIIPRKKHNKTRKIPAMKRDYPMIASMMPINLNTTRNQLF